MLWSFAYYDYNPKDQMEPAKALTTAEGKQAMEQLRTAFESGAGGE